MGSLRLASRDLIDEMVRRLVAEFNPDQIILFGSYAWGVPDESSDIDVMIVVPASNDAAASLASRAYRALGLLPLPAEIVVRDRAELDYYGQVPASLERRVLDRGRLLYERGEAGVSARVAAQGPS